MSDQGKAGRSEGKENPGRLRDRLEALRVRYNCTSYISPDPLQFVHEYSDPDDREVVAFIASSLAFGNVGQILRSVGSVLERMPRPAMWVAGRSRRELQRTFHGFRHRYVDGAALADALYGVARLRERYGSMGAGVQAAVGPREATLMPALERTVSELREACGARSYLVPSPADGSACKRLNLFLRWMVRRDEVDPGGWNVAPSMLVVPLDTHMHRIALRLGFTTRRAGDLRTALEVTEAFRRVAPEDPVRYDFALTRLGIRRDTDLEAFVSECGCKER